jgi:hypothetical protein
MEEPLRYLASVQRLGKLEHVLAGELALLHRDLDVVDHVQLHHHGQALVRAIPASGDLLPLHAIAP